MSAAFAETTAAPPTARAQIPAANAKLRSLRMWALFQLGARTASIEARRNGEFKAGWRRILVIVATNVQDGTRAPRDGR
jgi:hypothetical protein